MKIKKIAIILGLATMTQVANADLFIDDSEANVSSNNIKATHDGIKKNYVIKTRKPTSNSSFSNVDVKKNYKPTSKTTISSKKYQKTEKYTGKGEIVKGFANNLSLKETLEQIVPKNWKVEVNEQVNIEQPVSFKGGKPWDEILNTISQNRFNAYIAWSENKISIKPIQKEIKTVSNKTVKTSSVYEGKNNLGVTGRTKFVYNPSQTSSFKTTGASIKEKQYKPQQVKQKTWLLSKKLTLKENIESWAKKDGWTVAWKAPDYNVIADARFTGELDSEYGPIISILKNYEDSNLPLKINIMGGNKVIHVESRNYIPRDVVDLN